MLGAISKFLGGARDGAVPFVRARARDLAGTGVARLREVAEALRREARDQRKGVDFPARAIAATADAIRRAHGLEPYDCQLAAGLALAAGGIAEMATGEGKTLVALLPSVVFGLGGRGVHVATVNPYLAARDFEFARAAFGLLGVSTGLLVERQPNAKKRAAYSADVTYGVGTEFGFDYLRDQLALRAAGGGKLAQFHESLLGIAPPKPDTVQRGHAFAIIDEADSILIDEARSPLIISTSPPGPCEAPAPYLLADQLARTLQAGGHFKNGRPGEPLRLTPEGRAAAAHALDEETIAHLRRSWPQYVEYALRARHQMRRDVHFIVSDGKVVIVDEFTGRPCPDRSWRDGLHQAVEAAAGVAITEENASEATITRPAYFRLYDKICGMTGTAAEAAGELRASYGAAVRIIPLNRPCRRVELPDRVFVDAAAKLRAVTADIAARRAKGQPVLVGTRTVANSEQLAAALGDAFPFRVLNAKQDAEEAAIIASAGTPGKVTVATNMAGRGAHIPLPPESERAGGLHVIGLERHEAARIDRQLIGRAARQGQPGSAQFFLSLEDDLIARHAPHLREKLAALAGAGGELPAETAVHFRRAQRKVEADDRSARHALAEYDRWLDELKQEL